MLLANNSHSKIAEMFQHLLSVSLFLFLLASTLSSEFYFGLKMLPNSVREQCRGCSRQSQKVNATGIVLT